jgi:hypothetical protein
MTRGAQDLDYGPIRFSRKIVHELLYKASMGEISAFKDIFHHIG